MLTENAALHYAGYSGKEEVAHLLLDKRSDINARRLLGATPLMVCSEARTI